MFETFTQPAREAIVRAQHEAAGMGHREVQVEHLLLGLCSDGHDIVGRLLADFGLSILAVRGIVRELGVSRGSHPEGQIPFSPAAKDSLRSAYRLGLGEPGTEHILIALVARGEGSVSEILRTFGADPNKVRFETKKRVAQSRRAGLSAGPRGQVRGAVREILGELDFGD